MRRFVHAIVIVSILFAINEEFFTSRAIAFEGQDEERLALSKNAEQFLEAFRGSLPRAREREHRNEFPRKRDPTRLGVVLTAESALVLDRTTGKVLFSKFPETRRSIASITKLMSALVLADLPLDWQERIELEIEDRAPLGRYHLTPHDRVTRADLLALSLGASSNNAVLALVRTSGISREEFIRRMNVKAAELSMDALFVDPIGLDPGNVASASAVARLLNVASENSKVRSATTSARISVNLGGKKRIQVLSTNELLGTFLAMPPYRITAGKTGFIDEAGYCLAQTVEKDGHKIDVVVLGAKELAGRFQEVKALAVWAFDAYTWAED